MFRTCHESHHINAYTRTDRLYIYYSCSGIYDFQCTVFVGTLLGHILDSRWRTVNRCGALLFTVPIIAPADTVVNMAKFTKYRVFSRPGNGFFLAFFVHVVQKRAFSAFSGSASDGAKINFFCVKIPYFSPVYRAFHLTFSAFWQRQQGVKNRYVIPVYGCYFVTAWIHTVRTIYWQDRDRKPVFTVRIQKDGQHTQGIQKDAGKCCFSRKYRYYRYIYSATMDRWIIRHSTENRYRRCNCNETQKNTDSGEHWLAGANHRC